ncbi:MAG: 3D-(3,5/4)-trihydroxycyclohexane-1,2-dione acylhydrolase (decyclizing) [Clostridia bacterium]|nr:3D-(3,5/4)-trihydroxycyclohexane-1,2-dione acylhydrolase (decyclizing) [Clostridia bacterium]MDE7328448.1 3D-(3,5/4)-trihydroxycyclohexane-1,2-dione acylhydrolase (decyclizing) [Clostridia bacterium]
MSKITVGEAVVKFLDSQYVSFDGEESKLVEGVFTIFGHGCVLGIGEALSMGKHSLKVYQGKNEQGMAQAAIAYAKQNNRRKILPCVSSIGPGAANMVTAAGTATANNIPLLLFVGDTFATRQPDPVLQQIEQTYSALVTTNDAFKAVTRYFDRVSRPEMLMSALVNAIRVLLDPAHTGAVAIAMPQDVQGEIYDFPDEFFKKRVTRISRSVPADDELNDLAREIKASKKPLLIVGGGVKYSEAGESVASFCENHNIPFCETQAGKTAIKSSHPLNVGGLGVTGNSSANTLAKDCDLIIAVGTRFTDFTTASKSLYADKKVVTLNASDFHASKLDAVKAVGDAKVGIIALDKMLSGYKTGYKDEIAKAKADWDKEMDRLTHISVGKGYSPEIGAYMPKVVEDFLKSHGEAMAQTTAIGIIREVIPENAIIVGSAGSLPGDLQRMWTSDCKDSYNMEYGYSCMGYEIAGTLGSKMACSDREVYAMVGDGSYLMLHTEMITALQEGIKINVLLFDNASFGCINNLQMDQGVDSLCTELRYRDGDKPIREGKFMNIDYAMSARGYGFVTYTARNESELREALKDSLKQSTSTLIDIKVLPKSMTHGYDGWWHVGCSQNPRSERGKQALENRKDMLKKARKY